MQYHGSEQEILCIGTVLDVGQGYNFLGHVEKTSFGWIATDQEGVVYPAQQKLDMAVEYLLG